MTASFSIPPAAWTRRLDETLPTPGKPSNLSLRAFPLRKMPIILARLASDARRRRRAGWDPEDILFTASARRGPGPNQGVPVGGIGSGAIGRGWRGEFRRWQRRPGVYQHKAVWANQFSLFVQRANESGQSVVLHPQRPAAGELSSWNWAMDPACAIYHALFPRAWTVYQEPLPGVRLTCRQMSPVIPDNYRESSFPTGHFLWLVENLGETEATVSLMFSWQNGMGSSNDTAGGHANMGFRMPLTPTYSAAQDDGRGEVVGVELQHRLRQPRAYPFDQIPAQREVFDLPLSYAVAALASDGVEVTCREHFRANGDGAELWEDFASDGRLNGTQDARPATAGEAIGAAVAATITIAAGESREVAFALAWDMPLVRSGFGSPYNPRYTRFYGRAGDAAALIARDTLANAGDWEQRIVAWQQPVLDDPDLPVWYKMALFNELYYLVDGGTLWVYPSDTFPGSEENGADDAVKDIGHFAYLESHEYRMLNTYDVHYYASWALAMLWPKLELSLQRDIAAATLAENRDKFRPAWTGGSTLRKRAGAVPHDVGWPDEDPWRLVNGYFLHDTNRWKDLAPKFVLQIYRDYLLTGDTGFLRDVWPAVEAAVDYAAQFDRDGDGLVENDGEPDQTYDTWSVSGPSAYTGGLWLAGLGAAAAVADLVDQPGRAAEYRDMLKRAGGAYRARLWNGRYVNYDSSSNRHSDSIMADQLAGHWYARACGLACVLDGSQARSALQTILANNVRLFGHGDLGAVNGMRPDGKVDSSSMQSQEVWTGTTYALAATMLLEGMVSEAFETAAGIVRTTYERKGYWFQTPEAWDVQGNYRAIAYMRPLAIWAMQWAWQRRHDQIPQIRFS